MGGAHVVLRLFFPANLPDSPCRAKLAAAGALRAAPAFLEAHLRLHQVLQVPGGTEYIVGAFRYAQLAGRAAPIEVFYAGGTGGRYGHLPLRRLLGKEVGKAAVHLLGGRLRPGLHALKGRSAHNGHRAGYHRPARCPIGVGHDVPGALCVTPGLTGSLFPPRIPVLQCAKLAGIHAVEAVHAAGIVNVLRVLANGNTLGLAMQFAGLAVLALAVVNNRAE